MRRLLTASTLLALAALAGCSGAEPEVAPPIQSQDNVVPAALDPARPRPAPPGQAETLRRPRIQ